MSNKKMGYLNAYVFLKTLKPYFDNDRDRAIHKSFLMALNDMEYCILQTQKCEKYDQALYLLEEAREIDR